MTDYVRIRPADPLPHMTKPDGWRLVLRREEGENAELIEEQVLPERVMRPDANRILDRGDRMMLTTDELRWLRERIDELLPIMEAENTRDQAALDARKGQR